PPCRFCASLDPADSLLGENLLHQLTNVLVLLRQDPLGDDSHLTTEALIRLCDFGAQRAATDHNHGLRKPAIVEYLLVCDNAYSGQPCNIGHRRPRARGDQEML